MKIKVLLFVGTISMSVLAQSQTERPNIIFLLADDHQAFSMGCMGNDEILTPSMDKLAENGILFERCYATSPLCMASRATVMTGMYEFKTGCNFLTGAVTQEDWNTLAYPILLRNSGYRTAFAGKWGFPIQEYTKFGNEAHKDFDKFGGLEGGQGSYVTKKNPNMISYAEKYPHVTRALGAFGQDFIRESVKEGKPFCLSLSFKAPHRPHTIIDKEDQKRYSGVKFSEPEGFGVEGAAKLPIQARLGRQYGQRSFWDQDHYQDHIKAYYQLISGIDVAIGMVRETLKEMGVDGNTIIIYTADNGYFCGAHGLQGKVLPYERASRIPLIVYDPRMPAEKRGVRSKAIAANLDFSPTILELAGLPVPQKMDGRSLVPLINGSEKRVRQELGIVQNWDLTNRDMTKALAVVTENWKYIYWCYADENIPVAEDLYELSVDPFESHNVVNQERNKNILDEMRSKYDLFQQQWVENCVDGPHYKRYEQILSRHVSWKKKNYRIGLERPEFGLKYEQFLTDIYEDLTGKDYPNE